MSEGAAANPLPDKSEPSFVPLAEAHRREGLIEDAIRICREGLAKFPTSLRGRIVLGQCLLDHGAIGEAIVELGRVERESGGDPEIAALLCEVRLAGPQRQSVGTEPAAAHAAPGRAGDATVAPDEPVETPVLILDEAGTPGPDSAGADPLASSTLAGLYASQGERDMAESILRQITSDEAQPPEDAPAEAESRPAVYLAELTRLRHVAERLRKAQGR